MPVNKILTAVEFQFQILNNRIIINMYLLPNCFCPKVIADSKQLLRWYLSIWFWPLTQGITFDVAWWFKVLGSKVRTIGEKHTKFEKIFLMVLTNQLIYLVKVKTMRKIFSNYVCFSKSLNFKAHSLLQQCSARLSGDTICGYFQLLFKLTLNDTNKSTPKLCQLKACKTLF